MAEIWSVTAPLAAIHAGPQADSEMTSQLLYGETFRLLGSTGDWLRAEAVHDSYRGYIERRAAEPASPASGPVPPPHRFSALQGHIYTKPDFKSPVLAPVYFLSPLARTGREENGFCQLLGGEWVFTGHVSPPEWRAPDPVATAQLFLGTPYLWGGRSRAGLDCSGLVQLCAMAAGHACPRDTGDQIGVLGHEIQGAPQRGDFVFFKGHVGIMLDERRIINATARHMSTVIEDLEVVASTYGGILKIRRLPASPAFCNSPVYTK